MTKILTQGPTTYQLNNNYQLFRPIGKRVFAKATLVLLGRGLGIGDAVSIHLTANLDLLRKDWHYILWDLIADTMYYDRKQSCARRITTFNLGGPLSSNES